MCNRKKMTGRNVNPGLTEPRKKAEALERDSALYTGGDVIRELVD